ncbi:unnamed protein product [Gongylonema pulchrum]|uniref:Ig-like domain-containing protein n=1 Tax=Gongylonema pulchrum TaxID=637853 RepID=A0A183D159_9BILA|nr:unnamed protein product [Gongylonema pulchrum]
MSTNKVGRAESDTFLQVTAPPRIITPADELKVIQGQGQTIRCEVSGTPPPKVVWLKNGQRFDAAMTQSSGNLHYIHLRFVNRHRVRTIRKNYYYPFGWLEK